MLLSNDAASSYSSIADKYDGAPNETSFWGALARQAYENIVLSSRYGLVVDVGCGTGLALGQLRARAPHSLRFIGIEPAERMRAMAQRRMGTEGSVELLDGRFEDLPLADASVDYLYSIWAFHWVADPDRAASELGRVLKADADLDLWFVGMKTGAEFARATGDVLRRYVDLESRLRAASSMASFDRPLVTRLFSFLHSSGLTITEETETHYDTLERHWAWQIRSESIYSVIDPRERGRFDDELRSALAALGDSRGIPYTRHSFHVRYRHRARSSVALPSWLEGVGADRDGRASSPRAQLLCTLTASSADELREGAAQLSVDVEREALEGRAPTDIDARVHPATGGAGSHRSFLVTEVGNSLSRELGDAA